MSQRKMNLDHAETVVLPEHLRPDRVDALADAAAEVQGRYQEYVRSLDEVPVLVDVVREPPRAPTKDFRLGQRRDERKAPRGDAAELRDQHGSEIEQQYAEYAVFDAGLAPTKGAEPRRTATNSGAQKKRAKRAKRSARSKS